MPRPTLDRVRIAVRTLAKQPGFTTVVVLIAIANASDNTTTVVNPGCLASVRTAMRTLSSDGRAMCLRERF